MAETTLSKFGVPLNGNAGMLHPKQKYRFRVLLENLGTEGSNTADITQNVVSATRPKLSQEPIPIHAYNSRAYIASKHEWETIELVVRDDITGGVSRLVGEQVQRQMNHYEQVSATSGIDYKFTMRIETMDGTTDGVLDYWFLEGCFLSNVNYDDMSYDSSDPVQITMTIRYDNATHQSDTGNLMPLTPTSDVTDGVSITG